MIVTSLVDGKKWLWVNIPKTASTLIRNSIFQYETENDKQDHYAYLESVTEYGKYDGFSVVRDPKTRFISGLNHVFSNCSCGECTIFDRPPETTEVVSFLKDIVRSSKSVLDFHRKTYYNGRYDTWWTIVKFLQKNFKNSIIIQRPWDCIMWSFVIPQFVYLDGMSTYDYVFRYEKLDDCAKFVEYTLGYTINLVDRPRHFSYKLHNVDFNNTEIKSLIHEYYAEDYKQLGYNI